MAETAPTTTSSGKPVACYNVYRVTGNPVVRTLLATCVGGLSFTEPAGTPGACYQVQAVDTAGNTSPYSNEICTSVGPLPVVALKVVAPLSVVTGVSFTMTVTAISSGGLTVTSYLGTAVLTSTDPLATLPTTVAFVSANRGVVMVRVTLITKGSVVLVAQDTLSVDISGATVTLVVCPSKSETLALTLPAFTSPTIPFSVTVTAFDKFGNPDTNFKGAVAFFSTDLAATLPIPYTFTKADGGQHVFTVMLNTLGTQMIAVNDASSKCLFAGTAQIVVAPGHEYFFVSKGEYRDLEFSGTLTGWVVGQQYDTNEPLTVYFDGNTWSKVGAPTSAGCNIFDARSIGLSSTMSGWMDVQASCPVGAGTEFRTLMYHLSGTVWDAPINLIEKPVLGEAMNMVSDQLGWLAGQQFTDSTHPTCPDSKDQQVYQYDGNAWTLYQDVLGCGSAGTGLFREIRFVNGDSSAGYAIDKSVNVWRFDGSSWSIVSPDGFPVMISIWMNSPNDVWTGTFGNQIYHYDGATWTQASTPAGIDFAAYEGMAFFDPSHGVAVGSMAGSGSGSEFGKPVVLSFVNGTWSQVPIALPPNVDTLQLVAVRMTSATEAWAIGAAHDTTLSCFDQPAHCSLPVIVRLRLPDTPSIGLASTEINKVEQDIKTKSLAVRQPSVMAHFSELK